MKLRPALAAFAAAALLTACGAKGHAPTTTNASSGGPPTQGGTATYAEMPTDQPDYIFPIDPAVDQTVANSSDFQQLMWRPLVFEGNGQSTGMDPKKSLVSSIKYSDGSRQVTVTLKPFKWSDGKPVTSRDVEFDFNLLKANKTSWAEYTPGDLPDNVTAFKTLGPRSFRLSLNAPYSALWFTNNQLSKLIPLPQHAWDRTSASGKVSNADMTTAGAKQVFTYLSQQGRKLPTFTSSPLWKVVDGPWTLSGYTTSGKATFVPNKGYSGTDKPHLAKFVELPFTSDSAEFNVLRAGSTINVGYLPTQDSKQSTVLNSLGYTLKPWVISSIWYIVPNLTNPQVGPLLSQLYVRQAIEHLVPQQQIITNILQGYGFPEYGPVPLKPTSNLVSPQERKPLYPFSVTAAENLLRSHGWKVTPNGTDVCEKGGAGTGHCGAGVATGKKLSLNLLYATGNQGMTLETEDVKSQAAKAGITLNLQSGPVSQVFAQAAPCPKACGWQLDEYGSLTYPSGLPTGDGLWTKGGGLNAGSWDDPTTDRLVNATFHDSSLKTFYAYENHIAKELPWIWLANVDGSLAEVSSKLQGFTENVYYALTPEDWYYTKQ